MCAIIYVYFFIHVGKADNSLQGSTWRPVTFLNEIDKCSPSIWFKQEHVYCAKSEYQTETKTHDFLCVRHGQ